MVFYSCVGKVGMSEAQIEILLNGEHTTVTAGTRLAELLGQLGVVAAGTAVEVDGRIVSAAEYEQFELQPGQRVEIVRLVGGG